jgi:hypothetical protein
VWKERRRNTGVASLANLFAPHSLDLQSISFSEVLVGDSVNQTAAIWHHALLEISPVFCKPSVEFWDDLYEIMLVFAIRSDVQRGFSEEIAKEKAPAVVHGVDAMVKRFMTIREFGGRVTPMDRLLH